MAKTFEEAMNRYFRNVFVCKKCKSKIRATNMKVIAGEVKCRKCGMRYLRPKRKK
ncbi:50S ribosomal protein L40e [Candidatus Woesearchaeota archaeon CG_4_10_14_0_8_um_filter_47_5]|nr:MAG: 50S ribosomal protein L40e [Candidatus Woesearchaeota archaeon CG_4_10_14_0_8_um_filter_47_5]